MIYRPRTIKRQRRTNARVEQLDAQILKVLREDHPQSVRHVFYRMTDPRLPEPVEKSDHGYRHVQDRCVKLRRSGKLPYEWIVDSTRMGYFTPTFRGAGDFLRSLSGQYRADLWQHSEWYCEVWCESRSIGGVVRALCEELAVSLYPCGGFSSLTLAYEAATYINAVAGNRIVNILYVGDYDPAGVLIDVALERELRKHLDKKISLRFERIGITKPQIELYDLPCKPRKLGDKRSLQVESTVEAEAMPAQTLRDLLRLDIEAMLPDHALQVAKVAEQSEREHIERMASMLAGEPTP